jgi:4-hydroxythreonine-4-phosphate dehydrogenase
VSKKKASDARALVDTRGLMGNNSQNNAVDIMNKKPAIAITMGDPSGIGPEVLVKALSEEALRRICRPVVIGDLCVLKEAMNVSSVSLKLRKADHCAGEKTDSGAIEVIPLSDIRADSLYPGKACPEGGKAMVSYIYKAVDMCMSGIADAMVTCPINKSLMQGAGCLFEGHTQLIAHLTGTEQFAMMLAGEKLRVSLVSIHCALRDVPAIIRRERIMMVTEITWRALIDDFGIDKPRIAVAALNPHAGEDCLFGSEERDEIAPAIEELQGNGMQVSGPFPADTLFYRAYRGEFDAVVAMYHDQGLIPLKLLHFSDGVNVTIGLPIVRTSVDHGTAYDIAGKGIADPSSLKAAITMAARMAANRRRSHPAVGKETLL